MECTEPLCAGTGKCLDQHHVNKRAARSLDPDGIRAWIADQELNADFGGVCEHDHDMLYELIEKLLAKLESREEVLRMLYPDPAERMYICASPETVRKYLALHS